MDGNGRWAQTRGLDRCAGHRAGFERIPDVLSQCYEAGISVVSAFAWSTENWSRPAVEVNFIMKAMELELPRLSHELDKRHVRFRCSGDLDGLTANIRRIVLEAEKSTKRHAARTFNLAFNYGGRADIVHAAREILAEKLCPDDITEEAVSSRLWTHGLPNVDVLVRTGRERRISNFMLWQCAKARLYFLDKYWPDIDESDINQVLS